MGIVNTIGFNHFPKQGPWFGKRVLVCFRYDTEHISKGVIVRDDYETPFRTIIALDDGRYVLASECMYSLDT